MLDARSRPLDALAGVLDAVRGEYDLAILDCAPSISLVSESVFRASDLLLVPLVPATLSVRTFGQLQDFLDRQAGPPPDVLAFLSMVDRRKRLHRDLVTSLPQQLPAVAAAACPPRASSSGWASPASRRRAARRGARPPRPTPRLGGGQRAAAGLSSSSEHSRAARLVDRSVSSARSRQICARRRIRFPGECRGNAERVKVTGVVVAAALAMTLSLPDVVRAAFPGRDGLIAFTRSVGSEGGQIYAVRPDGSGLRQLTHRRGGAGGAEWSPDGRRITFTAAGDDRLHVFVKRLGGGVRQVTRGGGQFTDPTWSPDGRRIAAVRGHWVQGRLRYEQSLVVMRADGRRRRTVYAGGELATASPAWSPDGRSIAFVHTDIGMLGADPNLYVVPAEGGEARRITEGGSQQDPDWSPDGRLIAYTWGSPARRRRSARRPAPTGSGDALLVDDLAVSEGWPAWAPSGRRVAFSRFGRIWTVAADGTAPERLTDVRTTGVSHWDPSWQPR